MLETGPSESAKSSQYDRLVGGERGIRTLGAHLESVTYRFHIAKDARNAGVAVGPCSFARSMRRRLSAGSSGWGGAAGTISTDSRVNEAERRVVMRLETLKHLS
jgi:hypothetical protein